MGQGHRREVTFEDMRNGTGKGKLGYNKIRFCGEQARQDGLRYFWVDTCCINKKIDAEVTRSINSMFRWYRRAAKCYVSIRCSEFGPRRCFRDSTAAMGNRFPAEQMVTRGWTLQELLAPASVEFFSRECKRLCDKSLLGQLICEITNIPHSALQGDLLTRFSFQERLRWIQHRQTKLEEDIAYSLLGIFDVYILPIYGEGKASALARLKEEFDKMKKCIQDLHLSDPRNDKKRIENDQGWLVRGFV